MGIERLRSININDGDIEWAASVMGKNVHFDKARIDIIKNLESIDVQAFPGSGKTTTLVAKLAILAKKWPYSNSGICVLSHTNVAREEIEGRLGNNEVGKKLLAYPHFIGTLHSFFDTYVAIPWLRSKGLSINLIDSEIVKKSRWFSLPYKTRMYLDKQFKDENICSYHGEIGKIDWDKQGETREKLFAVIQESIEKGYFTFDEMLLYAKQALDECNAFADGIQSRFPIVFIDEAQDTNTFQWELLHKAFPDDGFLTIRQGFGDSNQAIYNYVNEVVDKLEFPRKAPLVLCESRRFDNKIATLANTVAISSEQMCGTDNVFSDREIRHTIYLFSKNKVKQVIDEFGKLVIDSFTENELLENEKSGCHIIGMVHDKKEETTEKHFPKGIYDYWPLYEAKRGARINNPKDLLGYFRNGLSEFTVSGEAYKQVDWMSKGIRRLINMSKGENFIVATSNSFSQVVKKLPDERQSAFRRLFLELLEVNNWGEDDWKKICEILSKILGLFDLVPNSDAQKFMRWSDKEVNTNNNSTEQVLINHYIFCDSSTNRQVDLEFGSIHSVKGRTHLATLVLETFSKTHNIKAILKCLYNKRPKTIETNINRLKCQYVAMTRARGLLCIAIPIEFVDEKAKKALEEIGWNLKILN